MKLIEEIVQQLPQLKRWRHTLHGHPELSFQEHHTGEYLKRELEAMGCDEVYTDIAAPGVVAIIRNGEGPCIGLRCEMDALPIQEIGSHAYTSQQKGVMHACGHDGHMAMLLGATQYLATHKQFKGTVACIFQPSEEPTNGAEAMIEDGLLQRCPMDAIYALHTWPGREIGSLFVSPGPVMSAVQIFQLTIKGDGGHAAMPQKTSDPIVAGAKLISALQTIVSRYSDPCDPLVISTTKFHAGTANNIIPASAEIVGTIRYLNPEIEGWLPGKMRRVVEGIEMAHDVNIDFSLEKTCNVTINSTNEAAFAKQVAIDLVGEHLGGQEKPPSMGSDDFCYFLDEIPGAYIFIGNGTDSKGLHHPQYDFNDEVLPIGASYLAKLVGC